MAAIRSKFLLAAGLSIIAAAAVQAATEGTSQAQGSALDAAFATPDGITLQPLGKAQGYDLGKQTAAFLAREQIAYADAKGMTLYTYAKDQPGRSNCVDACAAQWKPLPASAEAKPYGNWTIIARADGSRQWALKGEPVYTYVKDVDPGSVGGNSPARFGARRIGGDGKPVGGGIRGAGVHAKPDVPLPADWK